MAKTRELKRRIRSIDGTRKVTHAMELVAGAKMRRAQGVVLGTRRYAGLAWELLAEVRRRSDVVRHPLLAGRHPIHRSALFVISGNRGLVGAFHERIVTRALTCVQRDAEPPLVITMGKVARDTLHRRGVVISADFPKPDLLSQPSDAAPVAQFLMDVFLRAEVDRVDMVYVDFASVIRQAPRVRTLLPVGAESQALGRLESEDEAGYARAESAPEEHYAVDFVFEPSPTGVLEAVVPNLVSIQVYQALLETTVSEHAARMVTMRNATENADELHDDFVLAFNDLRKAGITQELLEMVTAQRAVMRS